MRPPTYITQVKPGLGIPRAAGKGGHQGLGSFLSGMEGLMAQGGNVVLRLFALVLLLVFLAGLMNGMGLSLKVRADGSMGIAFAIPGEAEANEGESKSWDAATLFITPSAFHGFQFCCPSEISTPLTPHPAFVQAIASELYIGYCNLRL